MSEKWFKDGMMVELTTKHGTTEGVLAKGVDRECEWYVLFDGYGHQRGNGPDNMRGFERAWAVPNKTSYESITPLADQPKASKPRPKEWTEVIYHVGDDVYTEDMINNDTLEIVERNMDAKIKRRDELTTEIKTIRTHLARHKRKFGKEAAK